MPKKQPLTEGWKTTVRNEIRQTRSHAIVVNSSLSCLYKKDEKIRQRWVAVLTEIDAIQKMFLNSN